MTRALKSPTRVARGIRSSYELSWPTTRRVRISLRSGWTEPQRLATVREIPPPSYCVVDERTGVLRAVWERVP